MYKIIFFFQKNKNKKKLKKYECIPYLKFSDPLPETRFFICTKLTVILLLTIVALDMTWYPPEDTNISRGDNQGQY